MVVDDDGDDDEGLVALLVVVVISLVFGGAFVFGSEDSVGLMLWHALLHTSSLVANKLL